MSRDNDSGQLQSPFHVTRSYIITGKESTQIPIYSFCFFVSSLCFIQRFRQISAYGQLILSQQELWVPNPPHFWIWTWRISHIFWFPPSVAISLLLDSPSLNPTMTTVSPPFSHHQTSLSHYLKILSCLFFILLNIIFIRSVPYCTVLFFTYTPAHTDCGVEGNTIPVRFCCVLLHIWTYQCVIC